MDSIPIYIVNKGGYAVCGIDTPCKYIEYGYNDSIIFNPFLWLGIVFIFFVFAKLFRGEKCYKINA